MRVLGKIFAAVISAMMLAQTFVMCAIADSVPSVNYTFAGTEQGIADGKCWGTNLGSSPSFTKGAYSKL